MCILGFNRRGGVRSLARFAVSSTRNMTVDGRLSGQIPYTARMNSVASQIYRTPPVSLHWKCQWKSAICFFFNLSKKSTGFYFINDCDLSCVLPWDLQAALRRHCFSCSGQTPRHKDFGLFKYSCLIYYRFTYKCGGKSRENFVIGANWKMVTFW